MLIWCITTIFMSFMFYVWKYKKCISIFNSAILLYERFFFIPDWKGVFKNDRIWNIHGKKTRSFMGKNVKYFVKYVVFEYIYIFVYISCFFSFIDNISILYNNRSCNVHVIQLSHHIIWGFTNIYHIHWGI